MTDIDQMMFSGHETFPFRYGWLKKGVDAVRDNPEFFGRTDAYVELGVGRNMVRSIRHWCLATQMVEEEPVPNNRGRRLRPSSYGKKLLLDRGWDPYLEDPCSLWFVHWLLVSNPARAAGWFLAFCVYSHPDFTRQRLQEFLVAYADKSTKNVTKNTLGRDVDCFVRTYVPSRTTATLVLEDTLDCPLVELRLVSELSDDRQTYRFAIGPKPSLPAEVFGFALLDFFRRRSGNRQTLSVQDCLYGPGSPGQAFKLDENSLISYVEVLQELTDDAVGIDETAGLKQIYCPREYSGDELLSQHHARKLAL